jgi:hypothetical protein
MNKALYILTLALVGILALPFTILFAIFFGVVSGINNPIKTRNEN